MRDKPSACCNTRKTDSSEMMYLCRHTMLGTQRGMMVVLLLLYSLLFLRPWQRTKRSVVPSVAFGACCALCLSTKLIYPSYSGLQRNHSSAALCPSVPPRLCWWHLAHFQRTEDGTKLPLKSITWVNVFIRISLKLSHQDDTQLFPCDLFLKIYFCAWPKDTIKKFNSSCKDKRMP